MSDWYRGRPFMVAFAVSVVIHAISVAFIPGFRAVPIGSPRVLEVEIAPPEVPQIPDVPDKPDVPPKIVEPRIERAPEPVVRQPQPEPPPAPRADIIQVPRAEPKSEFAVPKPESRPAPPPVARVEPVPDPRPEPRAEVKQEPQPLPEPPPVVPLRVVPAVVAPPVVRPVPEPVAVAPSPPAAAPQPQPAAPKVDQANESRFLAIYGQSISREIRRYQKYPPLAQRRHWEGAVEVLLQIGANGKVTGITLGKSSGYAILDEEALDMVRRASPLPEASPDLRGRALVVSVPIVFRLHNS